MVGYGWCDLDVRGELYSQSNTSVVSVQIKVMGEFMKAR